MERRNKIILIVIIVITVLVLALCTYLLMDAKGIGLTDATRFRKEYMELNDKLNTNGQIYPTVAISEKNNIKYIDDDEAIDILSKGTGVIYIGFKTCPWCRSLVGPLLEVASKMNETINYIDISDMKSIFEVKDSTLKTTRKGTKNYYKLLELLDDYLEDYYLTDEVGNRYFTNEKRIYSPTLIAVKDGKITDFHEGTLDSQKSGYDRLTNEQISELEKIITNLINSKNEEVCTQNNC